MLSPKFFYSRSEIHSRLESKTILREEPAGSTPKSSIELEIFVFQGFLLEIYSDFLCFVTIVNVGKYLSHTVQQRRVCCSDKIEGQ